MKEILIINVEPVPGATITKGQTDRFQPGFVLPVIYTLVDGTTVTGRVTRERKKDMARALEKQRDAIAVGAMRALRDDAGHHCGNVTHYEYASLRRV